ncbi:MAG: dephospho-CoA kinase [Synoicihabitans sp.]
MIIGLTGGMGCGKSTVTQMIRERGFRSIDSDALVRDHILKERDIVAQARERWGDDILNTAGELDRSALAKRVFAEDQERKTLESWVHPRVFDHWREALRSAPEADWVIEVPLLFEKSLENWFDFIWCVASSAEVQLARLSERGISHALAGQRISKQLPLARKLELADVVLWNDGSLSFLEQQVDQALTQLTTSGSAK